MPETEEMFRQEVPLDQNYIIPKNLLDRIAKGRLSSF